MKRELVSTLAVAVSDLVAASAIQLVGGNGVLLVGSGIHGSGGSGGSGSGTSSITLRSQAAGIAVVATGWSVGGHLLVDDALNRTVATTVATTITSTVAVRWAGVDVGEKGQGNTDNLKVKRGNPEDQLAATPSRGLPQLTRYFMVSA